MFMSSKFWLVFFLPAEIVFYLHSFNSSFYIAYRNHNSEVGHRAGMTSCATYTQSTLAITDCSFEETASLA